MAISKRVFSGVAFIKHLVSSKNEHGIHSPFVFDLYSKVISNNTIPEKSEAIEQLRKQLQSKNSYIDVLDFGAASKKGTGMRRIKDITNKSVSDIKKCLLLYHLVSYFKSQNIIELGTSFGLTTMYMALAAPEVMVNTVDGCSQTVSIARSNFEKLNFNNIKATNTTFDTALPQILESIKKTDFIFFDGNHLKEPTLKYFKKALQYAHNDTVFVFDDIHWSMQMNEAWQEIIDNPNVTVSIDLFFLGIVFFKKELTKQNFVLKF